MLRCRGQSRPRSGVAFQQFWRENACEESVPFQYREAYPHLVLQAFLQRVINENAPEKLCFGGEVAESDGEADRKDPRGQIVREMALGNERLDLGVRFRGAVYAVEVKKLSCYEKSHAKAYRQMLSYMDHLGVSEGWLVVADSDLAKPWDGKISTTNIPENGKMIRLVRC